ncbi:universal stress protein [Halobacterium jilantaiense]|uniref:Nucleotide-binding universal stress protein, UspA family n=1 Tax=Halobacterium jilantaiense TaxID=355548 RepID=A0A1I0QJC6_9EURY|nr:universal stress protein [Halobacterium jilantaiense]SEW27282.1 Nucleotide-binding universal stress protein, UspA family [Halobacterium jilantaiense]
MYDSVLVPTDGSDGTDEAVTHAIDIAGQYDATLHTLYVVESTRSNETPGDDPLGRVQDAGEDAVDEVAERARSAGVTSVETTVTRGVPANEILDYVADHGVDVAVMATAGRSGESRDLLGSVAESVVRESPVPVLLVNVGEAL